MLGKKGMWMKWLSIIGLIFVAIDAIDFIRIGIHVTEIHFAVILLSIAAIIISFKK